MDEPALLAACLNTVREALPPEADVAFEAPAARDTPLRLDGVLRLRANGQGLELPVELRGGKIARAALGVLDRRLRGAPPTLEAAAWPHWMLFAEYVPPALGRHLRQMRQPFADACGNAFLWGAGLFVWVAGNKPTVRAPRAPRLGRAAAAKVLFVLLQAPARVKLTYRELAAVADVAPDTVLAVLRDLQRKRLLIVWGKRERKLQDLPRLMEHWLQAYQDGLREKLHPQRCIGVGNDPIPWQELVAAAPPEARILVGGETAAHALTEAMRPTVVTLHVPPGTQQDIMRKLHLVPHPQGATTLLDTFGTTNAWTAPPGAPGPVVDPLLIHAELLLTGNDRAREAAEEIYKRHIERRFT